MGRHQDPQDVTVPNGDIKAEKTRSSDHQETIELTRFDLPHGSTQRIADARRGAEAVLEAEIATVSKSEKVEGFLPAFRSFALSLFDAEAAEALEVAESEHAYKHFLEHDLCTRIIEGIMPDRGLAAVRANWSKEIRDLFVEQEMDSAIIVERRPDETFAPARDEIQAAHAQHGDWEKFTPLAVRFRLRLEKNALVREDLHQVLRRRSVYWLGRFSLHPRVPVRHTDSTESQSSNQNQEHHLSYQNAVKLCGPDDLELLIYPDGDRYLWKIHNGGLNDIHVLGLVLKRVQSFDAKKGAFRESSGFAYRWSWTRQLRSGSWSPSAVFARFEGERLGLGDTIGSHLLPWPDGDERTTRRWLLGMMVVNLSKKWTIELDIRWTVGSKVIEMVAGPNIPSDGSESRDCSRATKEVEIKQEKIVGLFPNQEYPKYMHHATKLPVLVNSATEQTALGPEWSETYIFQAYPKCRYGWNDKTVTVKDASEETALGLGWADSPEAFQPYLGPRAPKASEKDVTQWVDLFQVPGLSPDHSRKIKAQLLRADAAFWRSPDTPTAFIDPMRQAFAGIADVLAKAGILTELLLQGAIPGLVWDSAIAGGWYRAGSEEPQNIFPERLGNYWVWRNEGTDWNNLFYAETQEWMAWLLENPTEDVLHSSAGQAAPATGSNPNKGGASAREERPSGGPAEPSAETPDATPREIIDRCRTDHGFRSYEKLAGRIGISKDTLYAITKETRWLSDQTYELVARFCKCKPEDLHPRDVLRRRSD